VISGTRGVDILTVGQYLRPSRDHLPIARFYTPDEFRELRDAALRFGFRHVESGPDGAVQLPRRTNSGIHVRAASSFVTDAC